MFWSDLLLQEDARQLGRRAKIKYEVWSVYCCLPECFWMFSQLTMWDWWVLAKCCPSLLWLLIAYWNFLWNLRCIVACTFGIVNETNFFDQVVSNTIARFMCHMFVAIYKQGDLKFLTTYVLCCQIIIIVPHIGNLG